MFDLTSFDLTSFGTFQVKLRASRTNDDYGFWKLYITDGCDVMLAQDPAGSAGTSRGTAGWQSWWFGEGGNDTMTFDVGECQNSRLSAKLPARASEKVCFTTRYWIYSDGLVRFLASEFLYESEVGYTILYR